MQIKYKFDPETKKKIVNSLWLSLISAGGAFIASVGQGQSVKTSAIIALATGGGFLVNTLKEFVAGRDDV
jgi:hypothetical protein